MNEEELVPVRIKKVTNPEYLVAPLTNTSTQNNN